MHTVHDIQHTGQYVSRQRRMQEKLLHFKTERDIRTEERLYSKQVVVDVHATKHTASKKFFRAQSEQSATDEVDAVYLNTL